MLTVGRPVLANRDRFLQRVNQILDTRIFTNNGPFVQELEELVCLKTGVQHCIAVANATLGLELILEALRISGEVITPSFSFVATAHALVRCKIRPVFCDIDPQRDACMSADQASKLVTERTGAIMPVNVYGFTCDLEAFENLSKMHNIMLIYDSAHGLGVRYAGKPLGGFGDAEVFSLHATKFVTGFEGGLITTNNEQMAAEIRLRRNFGFSGYDCVTSFGTNAKLSEIHAAMALTNLEMMDELIEANNVNYEIFKCCLDPAYRLLAGASAVSSNFQYVPVQVPSHWRDPLAALLYENGVFARKYFFPGIHRFEIFRDYYRHLPHTDQLCEEILCLPTGYDVEVHDIETICQIMNAFAASASGSDEHLSAGQRYVHSNI